MIGFEVLREIFPTAAITLSGNKIVVLHRYESGSMSDVIIEEPAKFALSLIKSTGFSVDCFRTDKLEQMRFIINFDSDFTDEGITEVMSYGEIENVRVKECLSSEEFKKILSEKGVPRGILDGVDHNNPEASFIVADRILHLNNHLYSDHSITSVDKIARWKKIQEIGNAGVFPFDCSLFEPVERTNETSGSFGIFIESEETSFSWKMNAQQLKAFIELLSFSDTTIFSLGIDDTGIELEILFSIEVYQNS